LGAGHQCYGGQCGQGDRFEFQFHGDVSVVKGWEQPT
jgi:hypothetical protein